MRALVVAAVLLSCVVPCGVTHAEPPRCPPLGGALPERTDEDATARLGFIREALHDDARNAWVWTFAWGGTGLALAAGGVAFGVATTDSGYRIDAFYGAGTSLLLPIFVAAWPLRVLGDERAVETLAGDSTIDPCVALARAEELLVRDADDESLRVSLAAHAVSLGSSILLALPLGLVWGRWGSAALNMLGSEVAGEAQILTTPVGAVRALRRYRLGAGAAPTAPMESVPLPGRGGGASGLWLTFEF